MSLAHRKIGLDYVRAAAILLVVGCHYAVFYGRVGSGAYPLGTAGVELFFVLSGYLIGGIFLRDLQRAEGRLSVGFVGHFWARRWMRTLPLYVVFLFVFWRLDPIPRRALPQYLFFVQNLAWPMPPAFNLSWSLAVEEWFYLLMPLLALGCATVYHRARRRFLATVSIMLLGPPIARLLFAQGAMWDAGVRKVVAFRIDAIMLGVVVAHLERFRPAAFARLQRRSVCAAGSLLATGAVAYLLLRWRGREDFVASWPDLWVLTFIDVGFALVLPLASRFAGTHALIDAATNRISLWSYSIYFCHEPIMFGAQRLADRGVVPASRLLLVPAVTAMIIASSASLYRFFELPIMRARDRLFPNGHPPPSGAA